MRPGALPCVVVVVAAPLNALPAQSPAGDADERSPLRPLHEEGKPYRTPRAGEGFQATLFGEDIRVEPRDRRSVAAWDLGFAATVPGADENELLPFASLYFWEHPDDDTLLRAVVVALYNEVFFAKSPDGFGPFELVATFDSFTVPVEQGELIDGQILDAEKLFWGYVRPGLGAGYRCPLGSGVQDNMFAVDLTFEPGFLYFGRGSDTGATFDEPADTFEARGRLQLRLDALERNLLELPHSGFAIGGDLVYGYRTNWRAWGTSGTDRFFTADSGRDYVSFTGYAFGAVEVPFVNDERHRLVGSVHGGIGSGLDRFSAPRVGGGPDPRGEEYGAISRPILPGAVIDEFFPENYVIGVAAYRFEPLFFAYVEVGGAVGYLDRDRRADGTIVREDDVLTAVGARLTTGFLGNTRLQVGYAYNFDVVRRGGRGGHEIGAHISGSF